MTNPGPLTVTTRGDHEVVMTRAFDAPRELVFEALTTPGPVRRWLLGPPGWSMEVCEIDLRAGGSFRYVWRNEDGTTMGLGGTYREVTPPERTVHTEVYDDDWTGGEAVVTTELCEEDGATTLTVTIRYASKEARDGAVATGMADGVAASYDRLAGVLAEAVS